MSFAASICIGILSSLYPFLRNKLVNTTSIFRNFSTSAMCSLIDRVFSAFCSTLMRGPTLLINPHHVLFLLPLQLKERALFKYFEELRILCTGGRWYMAHVARNTPLTLPVSLQLKAAILQAKSSARSTDLRAHAGDVGATQASVIG